MSTPVANQIAKLSKMGLPELREEYEKAFGKPTKSRNRKQLFTQIAKKLQSGDEPESAKRPVPLPTLIAKYDGKMGRGRKSRSKNVTKSKSKKTERETKRQPTPIPRRSSGQVGGRDPRLPKVGTIIEREYKGKKHLVKVLEKGFEYDGKEYRSLSALAKKISGQIVNGYTWFGCALCQPPSANSVKRVSGGGTDQ